jgi:Zn-finger nucleic acid-binding protein
MKEKIAKEKTNLKEKQIKCPKCNILMNKMSNGKYIIDKCPRCKGVFLDNNEIQNIKKISFFRYVKDYFRREKQ